MANNKGKIIGILVTVLFLGIFFYYLLKNFEDFRSLTSINPFLLLIISLLQLITILLTGLFIREILQPFKTNISVTESFYISTLTSIGNFFTPMRGGAGIRAVYLKKYFKVGYSSFLAMLASNFNIVFSLYSVLGLLALIVIKIRSDLFSMILFSFLLILFITTTFLSLIPIPEKFLTFKISSRLVDKIYTIFVRIIKGWNYIVVSKKVVLKLYLIMISYFAITMAFSYIEFTLIGVSLSFAQLTLYVVLVGLSLIISITPGSLGIRESVIIAFSTLLAITNSEILKVAVIDRSVAYMTLFVLYIIYKIFPINRLKGTKSS